MKREQLRDAVKHVGQALRDPEAFTVRWNQGEAEYHWWVWAGLTMTAILGTTTYGMTMGLMGGAGQIFYKGMAFTVAAGLAWCIPLPALYILNSLSGSRLPASSTFLAALVTVSWGGLALIASIPVNWFFTAAIPDPGFVLAVNLVVFTGVGVSMIDVFRRVMTKLEPQRGVTPDWFLLLIGIIGCEFYYCFQLFVFR